MDCSNEVILKGECKGKMRSEQISEIYKELHSKMTKDSNEIIETNNVIFQISTVEQQKNSDNPNVSSVDLGECEELLKQQGELSDTDKLLIIKTDIKSDDLTSTYVQYEIYNPKTLEKMSMDICKDVSIGVSVPVNLDQNTKSIIDSLSQSGYNLFDLNDSFYNDICSTYTTENGTDLTLADRKNIIYENTGKIPMCQSGCTLQYFNLTTNKAKCDCPVQVKETIKDIKQINFEKEIIDSFFTTLENSNFLVLKCYKLVFSVKGQLNNYGSYIMSIIYFIFIILLIIYIIKGDSNINAYVQNILILKFNSKSLDKSKSSAGKIIKDNKKSLLAKDKSKIDHKKNKNDNIKNIKKINVNKNKEKKEKKNEKKNEKKEKKNEKKGNIFSKKIHGKENKRKNFPPKRKRFSITKNSNIFHKNTIYKKTYEEINNLTSKALKGIKSKPKLLKIKNDNKKLKGNINIIKINNNIKIKKKVIIRPKISQKKINENGRINFDEYRNLNDHELNNLEYELARAIDKRTYFQYYLSLSKTKHLILFAFLPMNDYNLKVVKISLLLLSFSLYFTINGFFFSDKTMNKINKVNGAFNIIDQFAPIILSTIITAIINIILRQLSLTEKQILSIKEENKYFIAQQKSKKIIICLRVKLILFFFLSFLFMAFFWYYISCFCAVYKNTQMILIDDTLISFTLSMLYPFGFNLIPGILRIHALRSNKGDKQGLYKISLYIALLL